MGFRLPPLGCLPMTPSHRHMPVWTLEMNRTVVIAGLLLAVAGFASGCSVSSHVMVGKARPPTTPEEVQIYSRPPSTPFEHIATVNANAKSAFHSGGPEAEDKVIERLKIEAAKLGANGVILNGFSESQSATIGTGVGSESYGNRSAVGVGVGGSFGIYKKTGRGEAIYVAPVSSGATP